MPKRRQQSLYFSFYFQMNYPSRTSHDPSERRKWWIEFVGFWYLHPEIYLEIMLLFLF